MLIRVNLASEIGVVPITFVNQSFMNGKGFSLKMESYQQIFAGKSASKKVTENSGHR